MSLISGIQGQLLEVTVVGCLKLKDTEWISRQDPYVVLEYGSTKYRTRTCTDGGKNPTFQEKFVFTLIEGLRELNVVVWNSNTLTYDDLIGSGKIQLQKVLLQGYDDSTWPLQDKKGRHAGEIRLIMHYANANKPTTSYAQSSSYAPSAPPRPYADVSAPHAPLYSSPPPSLSTYPPSSYTAPSSQSYPAPSPQSYPAPSPQSYPAPSSQSYPAPSPYPSYPPHAAAYPPLPYNHQPAPYPPIYPPPPSIYPPVYPPPPQDPRYYPPGSYPPAPYPPQPY